jgi:hypothetical protein
VPIADRVIISASGGRLPRVTLVPLATTPFFVVARRLSADVAILCQLQIGRVISASGWGDKNYKDKIKKHIYTLYIQAQTKTAL